jgi:hypothetical protein
VLRSTICYIHFCYDRILNAFLCWTPIVDGIVITEQPYIALLKGHYDHKIPVAMGTTRQEAFLFIYGV